MIIPLVDYIQETGHFTQEGTASLEIGRRQMGKGEERRGRTEKMGRTKRPERTKRLGRSERKQNSPTQ